MDDAVPDWTGTSLLRMAFAGRLVLTTNEAEQALARIEATLSTVLDYLDDLHRARLIGPSAFTADALDQKVIDLCVAEMARPGQLAASLEELSRYAEALRLIVTAEDTG